MDNFYNYILNNISVLLIGSNPDLFMKFGKTGQPPHHFFAFGIIYEGIFVTSIFFGALYFLLKKTFNVQNLKQDLLAIHYGLWVSIFSFVFVYGQTSYLTWSTPHNMFYYIIIGLLISSYNIILKKNDIYSYSRS